MAEKRSSPVDWNQIDPEIAERLALDGEFVDSVRQFYKGETDIESVRSALASRDGVEPNDDELVGAVESAYLFIIDDQASTEELLKGITQQLL